MVGITFQHNIPDFTVDGIIRESLGIDPFRSGPMYFSIRGQVTAIIETEVNTSAINLNARIKERFESAMFSITEYRRFPRYADVLNRALEYGSHVNVSWDSFGRPQAEFIDTNRLGDLGDMQRIQRQVHPPGTLQGWKGLYIDWLKGKSNKYADTVEARLDIMEAENIAPFWMFIEYGNGPGAYPENPAMNVLSNFQSEYLREMHECRLRCLYATRALSTIVAASYPGLGMDVVKSDNKRFHGHSWTSKKGNTIFAMMGMTTVDKYTGRLRGKGFIVDSDTGEILRKWSGWLPE